MKLNINMGLLCDPAIPLLCSNRNAYVCAKCPRIFLKALFVIAKHWKLPKYTSVVVGINKSCYYTMEHYRATVVIYDDLQLHATV